MSNQHGSESSVTFPAPPPYTSVLYKTSDAPSDSIPPPNYADIDNYRLTYINNYPEPPPTDGVVEPVRTNSITSGEIRLSKNVRLLLLISGILITIYGVTAVGLEIAIIVDELILYYYFGFWAGILILTVAVNMILLVSRHQSVNYSRIIRSSFWQMIIIGAILIVGVAIIASDRCSDGSPMFDQRQCRKSNRTFDALLITCVALTFTQVVFNTILYKNLQRRAHSRF